MNILVLNHYAGNPALGMEYRPYYLAREWVRAGHRVMVVAASFSHVRTRQPGAGDEVVDGIAYRWLPTPRYRVAKAIGVQQRRIDEICAGARGITADTAVRLGLAFGIDPQFWLNLQAQYDIEVIQRSQGERLAGEIHALAA